MAFGLKEATLRRTLRWAKSSLSDFTPSTYFDLITSLSAETSLSAQTIFYLLRLSCGDADVFWKYRNRLLAQPSAAGNRGNVRVDLGLIRDHITHNKGSNDVCFELGRLYMGIGDYQTALELFEESNYFQNYNRLLVFYLLDTTVLKGETDLKAYLDRIAACGEVENIGRQRIDGENFRCGFV